LRSLRCEGRRAPGQCEPVRDRLDQWVDLERRARCFSAPYAEVVPAKIVLWAAAALANVDIAARLDTSPQVVHRWRKRFFDQRLKGLADGPRGGRPRVSSPPR
jgi:hypothetical protein